MNGSSIWKTHVILTLLNWSSKRNTFLDYIVLTVYYTQHSQCKFLIRHIEDLDKIFKYLEIAILWP